MPVTQVHGHHERSPVCRAGTARVTTRATAQSTVPPTTIARVETAGDSTGADSPNDAGRRASCGVLGSSLTGPA